MVANEKSLLNYLQAPKQFRIPIFQRRYSWESQHCEQLWCDVLRIGEQNEVPSHFLGSIVYIGEGIMQADAVPELLVIDGQQRLTTISLLILALRNTIKESGEDIGIKPKQLSNYYLFNSDEDGELRYKLLLTSHDKRTFIQLLDNIELSDDASPRLEENFNFFITKLQDVDIKTVYKGIKKLVIVDIALDRRYDDPQLIFESLNSTGLGLSQADLIRNYVLMGQETKLQNRLYKEYWLPMEQSFGNEYTKRFDGFIRNYLTVKTGQIPNVRSVYEKFKEHLPVTDEAETLEALDNISCYAKHFVKIALLEENDLDLYNCFKDIQDLRMEVAFPVLLEVYEDYKQEIIDKSEIIEILRLLESYVFRRAVCGIPTNSLNKTFAALMAEKEFDKDKYLKSFKMVFMNMTSYRRFPRDQEFRQEFLIKDVYNFDRCNYLLRKLESFDHKEPFNATKYTIEHILPQNPDLSNEWKNELGEDWQKLQEKYLHTIGNLTYTIYNPELSDRPFSVKKELRPGGFRDSRLRLNQSLIETSRWNETAIQKRAEELVEKALKIWIYPE